MLIRYGIASPASKIVAHGVELYNASDNLILQGNTGDLIVKTASAAPGSITWTMIVWLSGTIVLFVIFGALYFGEYRKLQSALPVTKETEDYLRSVAIIPKRTRLLVSDRISTPLTFGIFSPAIVFPKILKPSDNGEIKYVLTHEMIHIKRFDNLWKIVMLTAVSIHWFHPLVWIMYVLYNRDIELSCDEKVIALLGETAKKEYVVTLINLAEKQYHWSLFSNGFGKNAIQERIVAIMKFKKASEHTGVIFSEDADYEEGDGNNSLTLKDYEPYGISYDSSEDVWIYNGKQIAGLTDHDNIYVDGSTDRDAVYLQIKQESVQEISSKQFYELMNHAN